MTSAFIILIYVVNSTEKIKECKQDETSITRLTTCGVYTFLFSVEIIYK